MPVDAHAKEVENLVSTFERNLQRVLTAARKDVFSTLANKLSVVDGLVPKTQSTQRVLGSVQKLFQQSMRRAGYNALVAEYVDSFSGQLPYFQDTLDTLGDQIGKSLKVTFGERDKRLFAQQQVNTGQVLNSVVDQVALSAERAAMLSVGGLKLGDLIVAITDKLEATVGQATTLADTSLSMFYRTIQDRGYRIIERDLPDSVVLKYRYAGPKDAFVRSFCVRCLAETLAGKLWTRADIAALDNGQLPNVFLTCGGYNCRHQWLLVYLGAR